MRVALAASALALAACTGGSPETRPTTAPPTTPAPTPAPTLATDLKDGNHHAYVTAFDGHTVTVDVATFLTGKAAFDAYRADGDEEGFEVYVGNENPRLRTLTVSGGVRITGVFALAGESGRATPVTPAELADAVRERRTEDVLFAFTLSGGAVVSLREMFLS